jgi:periplasmic copper chaperone A
MRRYVMTGLLLVCVLLVLSGCAAKSPTASNAFSYACAAGGDCGVFMTIANPNNQADTLVAAKTDVAGRAELHTMVKDSQGGMKMQQVQNIPLPAAGSVELKPGSLHVMMFGLTRELKVGDTFNVTLKYETAGEKSVQVQVKAKN